MAPLYSYDNALDPVHLEVRALGGARVKVQIIVLELPIAIAHVLGAFEAKDAKALLHSVVAPQFQQEFLPQEKLIPLAKNCEMVLAKDARCKELAAPVAIIGDLHGCWADLIIALSRAVDMSPDAPVLFLGDYIDKGAEEMQVLLLILALKVTFPKHIVLLRGNHELGEGDWHGTFRPKFNDDYRGFVNQLFGVQPGYKVDPTKAESTFAELTLCALIKKEKNAILCMHAGIGKSGNDLLRQVQGIHREWKLISRKSTVEEAHQWKFKETPEGDFGTGTPERKGQIGQATYELLHELMWSDFHSDGRMPDGLLGYESLIKSLPDDVYINLDRRSGVAPPYKPGVILEYYFGPRRLASFFTANDLVALVRGHQLFGDVMRNGYDCQVIPTKGDGDVFVTVHTGRFEQSFERGAMLTVADDLSITAHTWASRKVPDFKADVIRAPPEPVADGNPSNQADAEIVYNSPAISAVDITPGGSAAAHYSAETETKPRTQGNKVSRSLMSQYPK
mmetsp:Transcript_25425/g.70121  ORF Transcript_25425/g.70121 Transcript_25425/m.70121 type:complete len:507 (-) Transcript_25425:638-2158(-)